jgi:four helix bundle protein
MLKVRTFMDLVAWQKAMALVVSIYGATASLPVDERFGLTRQMRNAAVSIPSNLAEGYGRRTRGEYLQFVGISLGSLRELQTQVLLCEMLGLIGDVAQITKQCDEVGGLIYGLERSLLK